MLFLCRRFSRVSLCHLVLVLGLLGGASQGLAAGGSHTTSTVKLRDHPSVTDGGVLAIMPKGAPVEVVSCSDDWCLVNFRHLHGYASAAYLSSTASADSNYSGRGYTNSRGIWVLSPTRTLDDQPPPGASAQCRDGTYSFSMSRRGTCSHHGGVARWL